MCLGGHRVGWKGRKVCVCVCVCACACVCVRVRAFYPLRRAADRICALSSRWLSFRCVQSGVRWCVCVCVCVLACVTQRLNVQSGAYPCLLMVCMNITLDACFFFSLLLLFLSLPQLKGVRLSRSVCVCVCVRVRVVCFSPRCQGGCRSFPNLPSLTFIFLQNVSELISTLHFFIYSAAFLVLFFKCIF